MEHHVYFWLKEEYLNEEGRKRMEGALEELMRSSNIESGSWGRPAATAERPVTDHSWTYGISLRFASLEDHDRYQRDDPAHQAFVAHKEMWAKALVMDLEGVGSAE